MVVAGNRAQDVGGAAYPAPAVADGADVDWVEVERRGRVTGLLLPALVVVLGACRVLLTGDYAGLHGAAARSLLLAVVGLVLAAPLAAATVPVLRALRDTAVRVQHALRAHVDPGPGLRARVDVLARRSLRLRWTGRALPLLPLSVLVQADWDGARALPAAVVLVVAYAVLAGWHHRQVAAASRWAADPPGPPRAGPPIPWWEPWLGGRRLLGLLAAYVLVVVVLTLAA
ncbi:hypothetical protein SAMN05216574_11190 [Blastococcus tunisiensis]|uniref:Uncharacterized protein n=1 Tax=Blastococcus tunisiensis TaxID=1798228 RepID=A0A1I2HQL7_9ACTN|nr:hypothetical protein SAMN05216574_11190 [Blastococcus sp. DSM 46838]